jgi:hypothetical protein
LLGLYPSTFLLFEEFVTLTTHAKDVRGVIIRIGKEAVVVAVNAVVLTHVSPSSEESSSLDP